MRFNGRSVGFGFIEWQRGRHHRDGAPKGYQERVLQPTASCCDNRQRSLPTMQSRCGRTASSQCCFK